MQEREVASDEKDWPALRTNEEADRFVAEADLTEYDVSMMVPVSFELHRKAGWRACACQNPVRCRKRAAKRLDLPSQRFMRQAIERAVAAEKAPRQ
jgi:hypothetical protein